MNTENVTGRVRDLYDSVANTWQEKVWVNDIGFKREIKKFANLGNKGRLLDVGIGAGDLGAIFDFPDVVGVDISTEMLKRCHLLHPEYKLVQTDAVNLPFSSGEFDTVCCRNLLQNFHNPEPAFAEMVRVAKPGATIFVVESATYENERQFPTDFCHVVEPFHPLFPSHEQLSSLFREKGIKNISQQVAGVEKKWLKKWQLSKGATDEQLKEGYEICQQYPDWYKEKYRFQFHANELDITSRLTFSLIKGIK